MLYELSGLTRVFNSRTVLDIPDLTMEKGRIHALLGPNGSGKTTLLNLLAFLDAPTAGTISFGSGPVRFTESFLLPLRRRVVLVDQHPILFTASVYANLEFGLKIRRIRKEVRDKKIRAALEMVDMQDFIHARGQTLSGGETKRIALARALVLEPEVLLCDEPLANVDAGNQERILAILGRINTLQRTSIIFSSHDQPLAERLARNKLYLDNGRLAAKSASPPF
ncbi:MAG: ABC transporter ATP-binding protein [Desulfobacterales bacterium]|nr:ABC transporter ATP-binding protein [Desulfobacterales bacterium]